MYLKYKTYDFVITTDNGYMGEEVSYEALCIGNSILNVRNMLYLVVPRFDNKTSWLQLDVLYV